MVLIQLQDQGQPHTIASEAILHSHFALRNRNHLQHFLQTFRIAATLVADSISLQLRALLLQDSRCWPPSVSVASAHIDGGAVPALTSALLVTDARQTQEVHPET
jgi:hypothetical protein